MFRLTFSSIRMRLGNVMGAFVAITIATTLIASSSMLIFTAEGASVPSLRFNGASLLVQVDAGARSSGEEDESLVTTPRLDAGLATTIAAMPGVALAVPDLSFYAQVVGSNGQPVTAPDDGDSLGVPWTSATLTPFSLIAGSAPDGPDEIVIDARLAKEAELTIGDSVQVLSSEMPTSYRVAGIATPPSGDALKRQSLIFFTSGTAARLSGAGDRADLIGVIAEPGVDPKVLGQSIGETLNNPELHVLTGNDMAKADPTTDLQAFSDASAVLGTMSGFAGFVAIFVLAGTFAFSIHQRSREIALLRAIGMTPRQVKKMIAWEAFVIACAGLLVAFPLSLVLARIMGGLLAHFDLAPEGFAPDFTIWPFVIAFGAGVGISQLAAFGAGRRAAKIKPMDALRESAARRHLISWPKLILGLAALIGGIVLLGVSEGMTTEAQIAVSLGLASLFLTAAALLGPLVSLLFSRVLGMVIARTMQTPGDLARWNSRREPQRVSAVASPLILAIGFASLMFCLTGTLETATMQQSRTRTTADLVVVAPGLPLPMVDRVRTVPGVGSASAVVQTELTVAKRRMQDGKELFDYIGFDAVGIDTSTVEQTMNLDVREGSIAGMTGTGVAVSQMIAETNHYEVGNEIELILADGSSETAYVAAIYFNGLGLADFVLPLDVAVKAARDPMVQQLFVALEPGADLGAVRDEIEGVLSDLPTATVISRAEYVASVKQSMVDGKWPTYLIIGVSVLFAGLAVINTMVMATSERGREFSLLRLIGGTAKQVQAMVLGESLIVLVTGATIGLGIGVACMIPASRALNGDLSAITVPPVETGSLLVVATIIVIAAYLLPARGVLRTNPMDHIGQRQ